MLGIIVQLALSWLIIWFAERGNLSVLGLGINRSRINDFFIFFILTSIFCASGFLMKSFFDGPKWQLNPALSFNLVINGIWWNIKSVLFEELIFRGVLLYILIRKLGELKGILISAVAFGIYHWFSFGLFGQVLAMAFTFILTGAMGFVLAFGYAKTFSLYIPIGIHLGWNLTQIFIFSQGPIGNGIFIPKDAAPFRTDSYLVYFGVTFVPVLLALIGNYYLIKHRKLQWT